MTTRQGCVSDERSSGSAHDQEKKEKNKEIEDGLVKMVTQVAEAACSREGA